MNIPEPIADLLILEGIVTTINEDGSANISPMGPLVDREMRQLTLRPFQTSQTYRNLRRIGKGILHVTDDVELIARSALGEYRPPPDAFRMTNDGIILVDACRWYSFRVVHLDDAEERTSIRCEVVDCGELRPFFGFNRAKHAVIEAAILATRIGILPPEQIRREFEALAIRVQKTAGEQERRAFEFLQAAVETQLSGG